PSHHGDVIPLIRPGQLGRYHPLHVLLPIPQEKRHVPIASGLNPGVVFVLSVTEKTRLPTSREALPLNPGLHCRFVEVIENVRRELDVAVLAIQFEHLVGFYTQPRSLVHPYRPKHGRNPGVTDEFSGGAARYRILHWARGGEGDRV